MIEGLVPRISKQLLERINAVVAQEEESHRELATVVGEVLAASESTLDPELMGRYIKCMQSFDQMRQRIEFLANTTKLLADHPEGDLSKLLVPVGKSAPVREDGTWLTELIEQGN